MPTRLLTFCVLFFVVCISGRAQAPRQSQTPETDASQTNSADQPPAPADPIITIVLVGGGQIVVDEVSEEDDGYWYKKSNVTTFLARAKVARVERPKPDAIEPTAPIQGSGRWKLTDAAKVKDFFLATFNRPLPLSAFGQSDLHTRWGWDHRNGMDVGLHPDSSEGRALIVFLREQSIPFLAFRSAIPGIATGPHIHIGNPSPRISSH